MESIIKIWKNKGKIAEGILNSVFKKEHVEEVVNERMAVCNGCEFIDREGKACLVSGTQPCCSVCGCSLKFLTRSLSSSCAKGKWQAVMTEQEEDQLDAKLTQQ